MENILYVLLPILLPILMLNALHMLLPKDGYVYLTVKSPTLARLLSVLLSIPIIFWLLITVVLLVTYKPADMMDTLVTLAFMVGSPLLFLLAKVLLKIFWKPSPEMLEYNKAAINAELQAAYSELPQEKLQKLPQKHQEEIRQMYGGVTKQEDTAEPEVVREEAEEKKWICQTCGKQNGMSEDSCTRCGRGYFFWGEAAPETDQSDM